MWSPNPLVWNLSRGAPASRMSAKIHADSEPMGDTASAARALLDTCKEETVTLEAVALAARPTPHLAAAEPHAAAPHLRDARA